MAEISNSWPGALKFISDVSTCASEGVLSNGTSQDTFQTSASHRHNRTSKMMKLDSTDIPNSWPGLLKFNSSLNLNAEVSSCEKVLRADQNTLLELHRAKSGESAREISDNVGPKQYSSKEPIALTNDMKNRSCSKPQLIESNVAGVVQVVEPCTLTELSSEIQRASSADKDELLTFPLNHSSKQQDELLLGVQQSLLPSTLTAVSEPVHDLVPSSRETNPFLFLEQAKCSPQVLPVAESCESRNTISTEMSFEQSNLKSFSPLLLLQNEPSSSPQEIGFTSTPTTTSLGVHELISPAKENMELLEKPVVVPVIEARPLSPAANDVALSNKPFPEHFMKYLSKSEHIEMPSSPELIFEDDTPFKCGDDLDCVVPQQPLPSYNATEMLDQQDQELQNNSKSVLSPNSDSVSGVTEIQCSMKGNDMLSADDNLSVMPGCSTLLSFVTIRPITSCAKVNGAESKHTGEVFQQEDNTSAIPVAEENEANLSVVPCNTFNQKAPESSNIDKFQGSKETTPSCSECYNISNEDHIVPERNRVMLEDESSSETSLYSHLEPADSGDGKGDSLKEANIKLKNFHELISNQIFSQADVSAGESLSTILQPTSVCAPRPIRVGLSRKQRVKHLHKPR